MTQVNSNIENPYIQQKSAYPAQNVKLPKFYDIPTNSQPADFKEAMQGNLAYDMVLKPFIEHPIPVLLTWLGLGVGLDAYTDACSGVYEKSLVAKAANLGDNIQNSKFVQSKPFQTVLDGFRKLTGIGKKAVQNSAILRAMRDTPTMPEWSAAKSQMFNQKQEVVQDFIRIIDALQLDSSECVPLKNIGLDKTEIEMLKKTFNVKHISDIPITEEANQAVNEVLLRRLGKTPEEIKKIQSLGNASTQAVKNEILKEMGLTKEKIKLIKEDMYGKYINDVKTAAEKVKGRVKMGAGHYSWMGPLTKPFERTVGCDEIFNKLHSMSEGAKTGTGKFMSKTLQMIHRGLTFGGGKLGALIFISPILVELAQNVKKADKDQKIGTAANGFVDNISWVFTFPLALKMLHSIGGIKYAGMSKEQVEQVRKITKEFNDKAGSGFTDRLKSLMGKEELKQSIFKNKTEYNIAKREAKKQIKELSTVKGQNIFTRSIRKLFGALTFDLGNLKNYHGGDTTSKIFHDLPRFFKDAIAIPMRFGVWGLLSMGLLGGILTKCTTTIFGKSYDSMKQDERKEDLKNQETVLKEDLRKRLLEIQQAKEFVKQSQSAKQMHNNIASRGRTVNSHKIPTAIEENIDNYTYIPSQECTIQHPKNPSKPDNYTYIPSQECTIKSEKVNESHRKYIPSQAAANINKTYDNSGLQSALDRAQKAEDKALRVLAGNFDGI